MEWYLILNALFDFLSAQMPSYNIVQGYDNAAGFDLSVAPLVCVTRGTESYTSVHNGGEGTAIIYIDMFCYYDGETMRPGYTKLNSIELNVVNAVKAWADTNEPSSNIEIMDIRITQTAGNADILRPAIGSYLTLEIDFSKRTL